MNTKKVIHSLLSQLSISELTNALAVVKILSQHKLLQPKHIDALVRVANELNIASPDFVETITVTTSNNIDDTILTSAFENKEKAKLHTEKRESDDIFVDIRGKSMGYKRSLSHDIDKLLS